MNKMIIAVAMVVSLAIGGCWTAMSSSSPIPTDPATNFRWNEYWNVERFCGEYQTLLGNPDAIHVPGSESADYQSPTLTFQLGFSEQFTLLGVDFPDPSTVPVYVQVSAAGFLRITQDPNAIPPVLYGSYYLRPSSAPLEKLVMPFWGNFTTVGVPDGGISYLQSNNKLIIEWRVKKKYPDGMGDQNYPDAGRFQAHLILQPASSERNYVGIEYHYDRSQPLSWYPPTMEGQVTRGAAVGLKNRGQEDENDAQCPPYNGIDLYGYGEGLDDANSLIILEQANYPADRAYTRVKVYFDDDGSPVPVWYGSTPWRFGDQYSRIFHYTFPPTNYRIKPVDNDILTIGPQLRKSGDTAFADTSAAYFDAEPILLYAEYKNNGADTAWNLPVSIDIYDSMFIMSLHDTIPVIAPGKTVGVTFDTINIPGATLAPGMYTACAYHANPLDQVRSNDTSCRYFFIRQAFDIAPTGILSPELRIMPDIAAYPVGSPISITGVVSNRGTEDVKVVPVGYSIYNRQGTRVHTRLEIIHGRWRSGEDKIWNFSSWTPTVAGDYFVEIFSALPGDQIPMNDTIPSIPSANISWWKYYGQGYRSRRMPFRVLPAYDIGMESGPLQPHFPVSGSIVPGPVEVRTLVRNRGMEQARNIPVRLRIYREDGGDPLHEYTLTLPAIARGSDTEARFPAVAAGILPENVPLRAEISIEDSRDVIRSNNSTTIPFRVGGKGQR